MKGQGEQFNLTTQSCKQLEARVALYERAVQNCSQHLKDCNIELNRVREALRLARISEPLATALRYRK